MGKPRSEIQVHNESIKARQVLLEDVLSDIKKYALNEIVIAALKNQGALASLSYKFDLAGQQYAIDSTSLNTLKKKSDELLGHHGFAGLERLRGWLKMQLLRMPERTANPPKRPSTGWSRLIASWNAQWSHYAALISGCSKGFPLLSQASKKPGMVLVRLLEIKAPAKL